jgi:hypothetical protein
MHGPSYKNTKALLVFAYCRYEYAKVVANISRFYVNISSLFCKLQIKDNGTADLYIASRLQ